MHCDRLALHVLCKQQQRPVRRLFDDARIGGNKWRDDVDTLRNIAHSQVLTLADEDVQPDREGERVREGVVFFRAVLGGGAGHVPDVPFIEADGGDGGLLRVLGVNGGPHVGVRVEAGERYEGRRESNGVLGCERAGAVHQVAMGEED